MAKPTKNATLIIVVLAAIALLGVILGFTQSNPMIPLVGLLPLVGYEIYRVEGASTRWAAWGLGAILIAEILLLAFNVSYDLADFLEADVKYLQGYEVPLADVKLVGPTVMAILCIILFKNTRGVYTKALAVLIAISSFAIIYLLDTEIFARFIKILIESAESF